MMYMTGLALFLSASSFPGDASAATQPTVRLALGYQVKDHQIVEVPAPHAFRSGESIVAWTEITGLSTGFVEHVWFRDGKEIAHHYLPVSQGRRWRTWSRHTSSAGDYRVEVLGPDGKELAVTTFQVGKAD
jgi:hypothetical protein